MLAIDQVVLKRDGREKRLEGQLLVTAADGGLLLMSADGVLWAIQPDELVEHTTSDDAFAPLAAERLAQQMLAELPAGFEVHTTAHYLICYNTSREYAIWCGRCSSGCIGASPITGRTRAFKLREPEFPLVAVVFNDRDSYVRSTRTPELAHGRIDHRLLQSASPTGSRCTT